MRHTLELIRTEALLSNAWARGMTILFVLTAFAAGLVIGRVSAPRGATAPSALVADNARLARPGPWGQIETIPISISLGVALLSDEDRMATDNIARADEKLYEAKRGGRNRVAV